MQLWDITIQYITILGRNQPFIHEKMFDVNVALNILKLKSVRMTDNDRKIFY